MRISLVIPTRERVEILRETVTRLEAQRTACDVEVIVVTDGDHHSTEAAEAFARSSSLDVRVLALAEQRGPSAARNRGLGAARGEVILFLGDDMWPRPGLLSRHASFHLARPDREAALLGLVVRAPQAGVSRFMEWLDRGIQFAYGEIEGTEDLRGEFFYTANVSVKTALVRDVGGFDEAFTTAAFEDIELGLRLERAGLRLSYDPQAVVEHCHPTDLAAALRRTSTAGREARLLTERHPSWPRPRRPGPRHSVAEAGLTALNLVARQVGPVERVTWRFLCHEAFREGYWDVQDESKQLRIGSRLASIAARNPATRIPESTGVIAEGA